MISTEHTSKQFDAELDTVRAQVLQMGGLVESQIRLAIEALVHDDVPLMNRVIKDDHRVNAMEVQIDESCNQIIARRQPAAIVKAIERIGDHAKNMSEYVVYMVKGKDVRHVTVEEIEREVLE